MKKFSRILVTILLISNLLPSVAVAEEINQSSNMESISNELSTTKESDVTESTVVSSNSLESSVGNAQEIDSTTSESQIETSETKEAKSSRIISPRITTKDLEGSHEPSKKGVRFIIPFRVGFTQQPQVEQYIRQGDDADLAVRTTSHFAAAVWNTTLDAKVTGWKYNEETGQWGEPTDYGTFKSEKYYFLVYSQGFAIPIKGLTEGTYYFQVYSKLPELIGSEDRYSEFAKVVVLPEYVDANSISVNTPEVIYEKTEYPASVSTEPTDTTSKISWTNNFVSNNLNDMFNFYPETGRYTSFGLESPSTAISNEVNTNVNTPGFPVNITASAENRNGNTVTGVKQIYYGGLAAKETPPKQGFNWNLNATGLTELQNVYSDILRWEYRWLYYDGTSSTPKVIEGGTGGATNLTELKETEKGLRISTDSTFLTAAEAASLKDEHFVVQVELKGITQEKGLFQSEKSEIIMSNKAELRVIPNELRLRKVPDLDFGQLPMDYIYEGTGDQKIDSQNNGVLEVRDTQKPSGGWTLNAKMTTFESNNKVKLEETTTSIQLESLSANTTLKKSLTATNGLVPLLSSNKSEQLYLKGGLGLGANPTATINKDDTFTSQITWNLVSGSVRAKALE